jgi:hypothetical protein
MEGLKLVVNQLSPKISQGIAPTLILIRVRLGVSNMQNGPIRSGSPSSMSHPMSSTQVRVDTHSFTEPGHHLPAEKSLSEIKSKPGSGKLGSVLSSVDNVATIEV